MAKRALTHGTVIAVSLAVLSACAATSNDSNAAKSNDSNTDANQLAHSVQWSVWEKGMTGVIPRALADDTEIQEKHGVEVSIVTTPNLPEVYSNLMSGRANVSMVGPGTVASIQAQGADVRIAGVIAPDTTAVVGREGSFSVEDLRGSRIAAVATPGAWALTEASLAEEFGLETDDFELVSVQNAMTGAAQVVAGTADFVVGWQPTINQMVRTLPELQVVLTPEDLGLDTSWMFTLAVSGDVSDEMVDDLLGAINDVILKLENDDELANQYGAAQGFEDDTISRVLETGELPLTAKPLDDEIRESILTNLRISYDAGGLESEPTDSVFTGQDD